MHGYLATAAITRETRFAGFPRHVMENGELYHFEFESDRIRLSDLKRFREYEAATSRIFDVPVTTYVVCSARVVNEPLCELREGINTYRVKVVMLRSQDADLMFRQLSQKQVREIRRQDLLPVLMSPFMSGEMPKKERVLRGVGYLKETYSGIEEEELDKKQYEELEKAAEDSKYCERLMKRYKI